MIPGRAIICLSLSLVVLAPVCAAPKSTPTTRTETFDRDPGWEGRNNRVEVKKPLLVTQDFGYSQTQYAGASAGEIGGRIQRSTTPASYAFPLPRKITLDDKVTASGSFAITSTAGSAGVFFGFFSSRQPGGSGRPIGSLGLDFDFEKSGGRLAVRLITSGNKSCGVFTTPYLPGKFRPTPIKNDGTRYRWTLIYDPDAASGNGQIIFTMRSETHTAEDYGELEGPAAEEARARFPNTTKFVVDVTPDLRKEGATFDRFGLLNMMKAGGAAAIYFNEVQINGQPHDFSTDPKWIGVGNRVTFEDREVTGAHNFGFSPDTNHAGGEKGEIGGGLWRSGDFAFYADRVGPFSLDERLEARGKVKLVTAGPDSDICIGWFNSEASSDEPAHAGNMLGVHIGGPTRIGHYFNPVAVTSKGQMAKVDSGPILVPGKQFDWSLTYDPEANGGNGEIVVTLGDDTVRLALKPGIKTQGATLDRFGVFNSTVGGQMVKAYFDDLTYSANAE
jgi:hypothetical protein